MTDTLREGTNELHVQVTGSWRKRLIGEVREPQAFEGTVFHPHLFAVKDAKLHRDEALLPSGLLGPVRLVFSERIVLKTP